MSIETFSQSDLTTSLPTFRNSMDFDALYRDYPLPDVWANTVFKWPAEKLREWQNKRFQEVVAYAWSNPFYARLWRGAGLEPGDITGLDDITKLPMFTSEDIKDSQIRFPPYGDIHNVGPDDFKKNLIKIQTSGGTTGLPRPTLYGPAEWEMNALTCARGIYMAGGRPGDMMQVPFTLSLANVGWAMYKACYEYLGISPVTTGSGAVTPSRRQIELAFSFGVNSWVAFPEYLLQLAKVAREELGRDVRDLKCKSLISFLGPDVDNALRHRVEEAWGCPVFDWYGSHEMGLGAFEGPEQDGLYLMEDCAYFEVCDVETNQPVATGEPGNLVITIFHRRLPPIVRFNLRDLTRIISDQPSVLGSSFRRMDKFLGRSDDMVKLRGVNVYPMACLSSVQSDPRLTGEWFCIVDRHDLGGTHRDEMTVKVETRNGVTDTTSLIDAVEVRLKGDLGVKVTVELVAEGALQGLTRVASEGKPKRLLDRRFK